eukprot:182840-Pyramimonas_sp.AAC.1
MGATAGAHVSKRGFQIFNQKMLTAFEYSAHASFSLSVEASGITMPVSIQDVAPSVAEDLVPCPSGVRSDHRSRT